MSWTEVTILVHRAQAGDRAAFGEIVNRFEGMVKAYALSKVRQPLEAEELAHEVFIHAMKKLPQLRDPHSLAGWLRQITARMAINRLTRRRPIFGAEPEFLDQVPDRGGQPQVEIERREAQAAVRAGLMRLKVMDRETLEAFYLQGHSLKQMSKDFEAPIGTIKRRLNVARQRLKVILGDSPAFAPPERYQDDNASRCDLMSVC